MKFLLELPGVVGGATFYLKICLGRSVLCSLWLVFGLSDAKVQKSVKLKKTQKK
jgi:hypothetical protein